MEQVGPYRVLEELGRGGMGVVLRAQDGRLRREVAIKLLIAGRGASSQQRSRFEREALALGRVQHPNVVAVHSTGEHEGQPYLVMDFVRGRSLEDVIRQEGPRSSADVTALGVALAEALEACHAQGVLHRDLKPDNVLVAEDGRPLLTDFGLARDLEPEGGEKLSKTGHCIGTPGYWPPEQAEGRRADMGPASDVYGLGALLYAALTGRPPIDGATTLLQHLAATIQVPPPRPSTLREGVDPALERVILRCLEKDPADRYASAAEVKAALLAPPAEARRPRALTWFLVGLGVPSLVVIGLGLARLRAPVPAREAPPDDVAGPTPTPGSDGSTPLAAAPVAEPQRLVLQPGPLAGVDTWIRSDPAHQGENYGGDPDLFVGLRRPFGGKGGFASEAYLRFSLDRLPPRSEVTGATLVLFVRSGLRPTPIVVQAVRPSAAHPDADWPEGTSSGGERVDGLVWSAPTKRGWSRPRAYAQPRIRLRSPPGREGQLEVRVRVLKLVRGWASGTIPNHGLRMTVDTSAGPTHFAGSHMARYASSDDPDPHRWPALIVEYRGAPPAPAPSREAVWRAAEQRASRLREGAGTAPDLRTGVRLLRLSVQAAPFSGAAWFALGERLRHLDRRQAYKALRRADATVRPYRDRIAVLRLRAGLAIQVGDPVWLSETGHALTGFLEPLAPAQRPHELVALLAQISKLLPRGE